MYKYMTWTKGTYYECNQLIEHTQVARLLEVFKQERMDTYVTIQDYDSDGNIIGCPLYFDIDAPSLVDAKSEADDLYYMVEEMYGVEPVVFFSGGKGFHLLAPLYIKHPRCHEIVEMIWKDQFSSVECDPSVYRTRSMLRCENTWNSKGERYKVHLNGYPAYSLGHILEMAKDKVQPKWKDGWKLENLEVDSYVERLPQHNQLTGKFSGNLSFNEDMMPCLSKLWEEQVPPEGTRHELAYTMVKHCYRSGLEQHEVYSLFASHPFWSGVSERDYGKIIESVYRTGRAMIGCKNNQLLRSRCVNLCKYNHEMDTTGVFS